MANKEVAGVSLVLQTKLIKEIDQPIDEAGYELMKSRKDVVKESKIHEIM